MYYNLKNINGKHGDQVVVSLLSSVFEVDTKNTKRVEQHLARYIELLITDKVLKPKDINMGLSRMGDLISELVLDYPHIHRNLMDYFIRPLH